jgi:hypothetical protein
MPSTYNKEKAWDTEDIDKWKVGLSNHYFPKENSSLKSETIRSKNSKPNTMSLETSLRSLPS